MRPADICNPHFKDEHPGSVWLRRWLDEDPSPWTTRFTSRRPLRPAAHDRGRLFADHGRWNRRDSDTSVTLRKGSDSRPIERPRPLSPPPREERRLPRPETPSAIERLSANRGPWGPSPAPEPSTSFADAGLPAGLGPRPPPRPQPRWLLWARRCSMTSATKTESGAHHPSSKTSRAPLWFAIRRGLAA